VFLALNTLQNLYEYLIICINQWLADAFHAIAVPPLTSKESVNYISGADTEIYFRFLHFLLESPTTLIVNR
jgi:hypothetical protein